MDIDISKTPQDLGKKAGERAGELLRKTIEAQGEAHLVLAAGTSQLETLQQLITEKVAWDKVTLFQLKEYVGISDQQNASFRKYIKDRFIDRVAPLKAYYLINGKNDPSKEQELLNKLVGEKRIDLALVGIGENGHLAFNNPPADFDTETPYLIVELTETYRNQQVSGGWFKSIDEVPRQSITMSIHQIMKSNCIICSVPDKRKAKAIRNCLTGQVSYFFPASVLQVHPLCFCYLEESSASLLPH